MLVNTVAIDRGWQLPIESSGVMIRVRSGIASHIFGLGLDCLEGSGPPVSLLHRSEVVGKAVDIGLAHKPFAQFAGHSVGQRRVSVQAGAIGKVCVGQYPLLAGTNTSAATAHLSKVSQGPLATT